MEAKRQRLTVYRSYWTTMIATCVVVAAVSICVSLFYLRLWHSSDAARRADLIDGGHQHPIGHEKPLGFHRTPFDVHVLDDVLDLPEPSEFFANYVRLGKPVVFHGFARRAIPAYSLWTDDYLSEKYGHLAMTVEARKVEDRIKEDSFLNITLSEFLAIYRTRDVYMVQTAPYEMLDDFHLPRFVACADLLNVMSDAVVWMSSGGTKSVLHYDEFDNVNCVLDGVKEFFLVDKIDASHINVTDSRGAYCDVDVDSVDMYRYPGLRDVPWYKATLNKGDCIFIPYKWFHQVTSYGDRNLALNVWFVHLYWIDTQLCPNSAGDEAAPMSIPFDKLDFCAPSECLSAHEGKTVSYREPIGYFNGIYTMHANDVYSVLALWHCRFVTYVCLANVKAELIGLGNGTDLVGLDFFRDVYGRFANDDSPFTLDSIFQVFDADGDGFVSLQELYKQNATLVLSLFPKFTKNRSLMK